MLCCDTEQSLSSISPESNPFHRSHKVLLTFKIHSAGFIHWSEVARAPKTNRGLRSGISDGQVPSTPHCSHTLGHTVGDNTGHEPDLLLAIFFPCQLVQGRYHSNKQKVPTHVN